MALRPTEDASSAVTPTPDPTLALTLLLFAAVLASVAVLRLSSTGEGPWP